MNYWSGPCSPESCLSWLSAESSFLLHRNIIYAFPGWPECCRTSCISTFYTFDPSFGGLGVQTTTDRRLHFTKTWLSCHKKGLESQSTVIKSIFEVSLKSSKNADLVPFLWVCCCTTELSLLSSLITMGLRIYRHRLWKVLTLPLMQPHLVAEKLLYWVNYHRIQKVQSFFFSAPEIN